MPWTSLAEPESSGAPRDSGRAGDSRREMVTRVLLVEDSPTDSELIAELLARGPIADVEVAHVDRLSAARHALECGTYDVVLVDLQLPDARGMEAVVHLRSLAPATPIVVLTGNDDDETALAALRSQADDFLAKRELSSRTLARAIRYSIERRGWQGIFRHLVAKYPDAALLVDADGFVVLANPAAERLLGVGSARLEMRRFPFSVHADEIVEVEVAPNVIVEMRAARIEWNGEEAHLVSLHDVTRRKRSEESLRQIATELRADRSRLETLVATDALTGILNRRGLEQVLATELSRVNRYGAALTSILVDCDNFKEINASYGYGGGDAVLGEIAHRLKGLIRATDRVGRIGGDEFLILLPETRLAEAMVLGERVRMAIGSPPVKFGSDAIRVTASLGIAAVPAACSVEEIFWLAQRALTKSKRHGKNRVMVEDEADAEPQSVRGHAGERVEELMRRPEWLATAAQSIRSLATLEIVGYELLARVHGGEFTGAQGLFMAALGRNVLVPLDLHCLKTAVRAASRMTRRGRFHVNLFPSTILSTPPELLLELFDVAGGPHAFCIEISEHELIRDFVKFREQISAARKRNVLIALDDVGFGRSSLEALVVLEPDFVKLDRRCIEDVVSNPNRNRQLRRLMAVIESLGAIAVAEGVESHALLEALRDIGVPQGQGFLWGKPEEV